MTTNKRLLHEVNRLMREQMSRPLLDNQYLVHLNEEDTSIVHSIIKAPYDSVYRHTFIRLDFKIGNDYPHSPPEVTFVNHDSVRIHPNMYEDGKCCSTILNTWPSDNEKWTSSMGIETILLAFLSFLDYNPYTHEPGGRDDPSYTIFVRHQSFKTCLLRYIQYETITPFIEFISVYVHTYRSDILKELEDLNWETPPDYYYTPCFEIDRYYLDYDFVKCLLISYFYGLPYISESGEVSNEINQDGEGGEGCLICFEKDKPIITLQCTHQFHNECLEKHIKNNGDICPICRRDSTEWVINPRTKRRLKRNSRTFNKLLLEKLD